MVTFLLVAVSAGCEPASNDDDSTGDDDDSTGDDDDSTAGDIAQRLAAIEGLSVTEVSSIFDERVFELVYVQPIDHADADGPSYEQHMTLLHRDETVPLVLVSTGYANYLQGYEVEVTEFVEGNQLALEKRYHGESRPAAVDWTTMSIDQIAEDAHRITSALKAIYTGPWIGTGGSLGGEDSLFHRQRHPEDVVGTIAFGSPLVLGYPDERFVDFFETVPPADCQAELERVQEEILGNRRGPMIEQLESMAAANGYQFTRLGGVEAALESATVSLPWTFWQYAYEGPGQCAAIPPPSASDQTVYSFFASSARISWAADESWQYFAPYYFQAQFELGVPAVPLAHLEGLVDPDVVSFEEGFLPDGAPPPAFDAGAMPATAQWIVEEGSEIILVYGEYDPWSAGAIDIGGAGDVWSFVAPGGNHLTGISDLAAADEDAVLDRLAAWAEIEP